MIEAGVELLIPFIMALALEHNDTSYTLKAGAVMLAIIVSGSVLATLGQYYSAKAATSVSRKMREDMYKKINSLEYYDIDKLGTSSLINRLTADVNAVQSAVLIFVRIAIRAPFLVVGSIVFAMLIDPGIALIIVACLPFLIASFYIITRRLMPKYTSIQKTLDGITLETKENLDGIRVVRAFNKQEQEVSEFNKYTGRYADMSVEAGKMSAGLGPLNTFIINCGVIAILYFVGRAVKADRFDVANISAFISYMVQIVTALNMITNLTLNFVKASASNKRIKEVFTEKSALNTYGAEIGAVAPNENAENILEFKNVSFGYEENGFILSDVSFELKKGQTLGIIGGTGSGKTTLINLIPRFYDVKSGGILFKGIDVKDYPAGRLRKEVVIVAQEAVVLSGTIIDNIRFASADLSEDGIVTAAKIAQAHEFIIKMPEGYYSIAEQNGRNLSGGQKQRISIARGIARNADLLILDDSSSALDYLTESKLRTALKALEATTKIIISQRTSSVKSADKILVMDKGRAVGIGSHEELLLSCGQYRNIHESQNI
jgi:ATP-binding cassette subfamily B protein